RRTEYCSGVSSLRHSSGVWVTSNAPTMAVPLPPIRRNPIPVAPTAARARAPEPSSRRVTFMVLLLWAELAAQPLARLPVKGPTGVRQFNLRARRFTGALRDYGSRHYPREATCASGMTMTQWTPFVGKDSFTSPSSALPTTFSIMARPNPDRSGAHTGGPP